MKFSVLLLVSLLSINTWAKNSSEALENVELIETEISQFNEIKIKDVKKIIQEVGPENTCMDEYLKRRNRLILSLSISPAVLVGSAYAGGLVGLVAAETIGGAINPVNGFETFLLGSIAGGAMIAPTIALIQTGSQIKQLREVNLILKALAEIRIKAFGEKINKLYAKYSELEEYPLDKSFFMAELLALDSNNELCDGSMTRKNSKLLKHRLARLKNIAERL